MEDFDIRKGTRPSKDVTAARVQIMERLLSQPNGCTTKELIEACGMTKQAVSQHLQKLRAIRENGRWYLKPVAQEGV